MTKSRQEVERVRKANSGVITEPAVQKYSITSRCFPLALVGRNSAKISNGTVNPPTPKPTINRIPSKLEYPVLKAVNTPNTEIIAQDNKNAGLLP